MSKRSMPRFWIQPRRIGPFTRIVACLGGLGFAVIGVLAFRDSNWVGTIDMIAATALFLLSAFHGVDLGRSSAWEAKVTEAPEVELHVTSCAIQSRPGGATPD